MTIEEFWVISVASQPTVFVHLILHMAYVHVIMEAYFKLALMFMKNKLNSYD